MSLIAAQAAPPALLGITSQIPPVFSALKTAINVPTPLFALCVQEGSPRMLLQESARWLIPTASTFPTPLSATSAPLDTTKHLMPKLPASPAKP